MDVAETTLPAGFEALEPFVAEWVLPDSLARMAKRRASNMDEIKAFYNAAIAQAEGALNHLRAFPLGDIPPAEERLLKLMLALAEVGPAVEWFDSPHVYDGFEATKVRYIRTIPDTAAQA